MNDADAEKAMAFMKAQCAATGVGSVQVSDGQFFMFSKETIEMLMKKFESGSEEVILFVKSGGEYVKN